MYQPTNFSLCVITRGVTQGVAFLRGAGTLLCCLCLCESVLAFRRPGFLWYQAIISPRASLVKTDGFESTKATNPEKLCPIVPVKPFFWLVCLLSVMLPEGEGLLKQIPCQR